MFKRILVTGGAGFIGSAFVRHALLHSQIETLIVLDALTYAANIHSLDRVAEDARYHFVQGDILDTPLVEKLIQTHSLDAIVHFAAESHVDRSIDVPKVFYRTNVEGTLSLLDAVRTYPQVHFHHVSTDEVYGSIEKGAFTENSTYHPNSPYSASKAASDHFVHSYATTYGISTTMSHGSNTYGPYQYPEKFIPHMLRQLIDRKPLPVYGKGENIRDWIFVDDHVDAIWKILQTGKRGERYNVGGQNELRNIDLLKILIERYACRSRESVAKYEALISHVKDRPGHDFRYALSCEKIESTLGWKPRHAFTEGIDQTIQWYEENRHVRK